MRRLNRGRQNSCSDKQNKELNKNETNQQNQANERGLEDSNKYKDLDAKTLLKLESLGKGGFGEVSVYYDHSLQQALAVKQFKIEEHYFEEKERNTNCDILLDRNRFFASMLSHSDSKKMLFYELGDCSLLEINNFFIQQNYLQTQIFNSSENIINEQQKNDHKNTQIQKAKSEPIIRKNKTLEQQKWREIDLVYITYSLLNALIYMRQNKMFHGDISPDNIMIFQNKLKFIDLGSSHLNNNSLYLKQYKRQFVNWDIMKHNKNYSDDEITQNELYALGRTITHLCLYISAERDDIIINKDLTIPHLKDKFLSFKKLLQNSKSLKDYPQLSQILLKMQYPFDKDIHIPHVPDKEKATSNNSNNILIEKEIDDLERASRNEVEQKEFNSSKNKQNSKKQIHIDSKDNLMNSDEQQNIEKKRIKNKSSESYKVEVDKSQIRRSSRIQIKSIETPQPQQEMKQARKSGFGKKKNINSKRSLQELNEDEKIQQKNSHPSILEEEQIIPVCKKVKEEQKDSIQMTNISIDKSDMMTTLIFTEEQISEESKTQQNEENSEQKISDIMIDCLDGLQFILDQYTLENKIHITPQKKLIPPYDFEVYSFIFETSEYIQNSCQRIRSQRLEKLLNNHPNPNKELSYLMQLDQKNWRREAAFQVIIDQLQGLTSSSVLNKEEINHKVMNIILHQQKTVMMRKKTYNIECTDFIDDIIAVCIQHELHIVQIECVYSFCLVWYFQESQSDFNHFYEAFYSQYQSYKDQIQDDDQIQKFKFLEQIHSNFNDKETKDIIVPQIQDIILNQISKIKIQ